MEMVWLFVVVGEITNSEIVVNKNNIIIKMFRVYKVFCHFQK